MKITVDFHMFAAAFDTMRPDNFSRQGLRVLFDYLEQYEEEDNREEIELNTTDLCREYSEESMDSIAQIYDIDLSECEDDESKADTVKEYLEGNTILIGEVPGGFVYSVF